jgi:hypothetical protein
VRACGLRCAVRSGLDGQTLGCVADEFRSCKVCVLGSTPAPATSSPGLAPSFVLSIRAMRNLRMQTNAWAPTVHRGGLACMRRIVCCMSHAVLPQCSFMRNAAQCFAITSAAVLTGMQEVHTGLRCASRYMYKEVKGSAPLSSAPSPPSSPRPKLTKSTECLRLRPSPRPRVPPSHHPHTRVREPVCDAAAAAPRAYPVEPRQAALLCARPAASGQVSDPSSAHRTCAHSARTAPLRALVSDCRGGGGEDAAAADVCEATAHADRYGLTARAPAKAFGGAVLGWGEGASFRRPFFGLPTELAMEQTP